MTLESVHSSWSSRSGFLLASVGMAVGLGNLWRFPYIAGLNGGGAFVLLYIFFVMAFGVPIIMAELALGRRGRESAVGTMAKLTDEANASPFWMLIGWLSLAAPFLGLAYYSIVAGWSFDYFYRAVSGAFAGLDPESSGAAFNALQADPVRIIALQFAFLAMTILIVGRGVQKGIEKASKIMMPALFVLLILMVIYAAVAGDFMRGLTFLFNPDFSALTGKAVLMAMGQAFFSLAAGAGGLIVYGAYVPKDQSLPQAALVIAGADTAVAILAGLAIFPIVFAFGLDPADGPGLIFVTLPAAFGGMPAGALFGALFFVLFFFAGLTSALAMLEPAVCWLEERWRVSRMQMAATAGILAGVIGLGPALSFNVLADIKLLYGVPGMGEWNIFQIFDGIVANLLLPINALLISLFAGWVLSREAVGEELGLTGPTFKIWLVSVRYLAPIAIAAIVVFGFIAE